jgi:hypothetical protein
MAAPHKICETSLRWILAIRARKSSHGFDFNKINKCAHPEIFGDACGDFGHSGGSFAWSFIQAKHIEKIGLEKWIASEAARGYAHAFEKQLTEFLR